ncbi:MAG: tetratricopeptide repeat protein, partial [Thermoanaerobaculia bacterium]
ARLGRGAALLAAREFNEAVIEFRVARKLWPDSLEAGLLIGKAYYLMGKPELAEREFLKLHEQSRFQDGAALAVAAIYRYLAEYRKGLQWAGKVKRAHLRESHRAQFYCELGSWDEAIQAARSALVENPRDVDAREYLGIAIYRGKRDSEESVRLLREALQIDPQHYGARFQLAQVLMKTGRLDLAELEYLTAIRTNPRSAAPHHRLAAMYALQGRFDEAVEKYLRAIALDQNFENSAQAHAELGSVLALQGKPAEALDHFTQAIEIYPEHLRLEGTLPRLLRSKGRYLPPERLRRLAQAIERALKLVPENRPMCRALLLAEYHASRGRDLSRSLECARRLVEKSGRGVAGDLALLAEVERLAGRGGEAARTLEEAVRLPDASED